MGCALMKMTEIRSQVAHIRACFRLLKKSYRSQAGLHDTLHLKHKPLQCASPTDFVQIAHISQTHWVCLSSINGVIEVFDSIPNYSVKSKSSTSKQQHLQNATFPSFYRCAGTARYHWLWCICSGFCYGSLRWGGPLHSLLEQSTMRKHLI